MSTYKTKIKILSPIVRFLWPVKVINRHRFRDGKGVYICNHYGIMDANPMCGYLFHNKFNVVVKHDSYKGPLKPIMKAVNAIPINRTQTDFRAIKQCLTVLRNNEPLLIFPEGTRNKSNTPKKLLPFKEGAAMFALKTNAPIIPMIYYDCPRLFRKTYLNIGEPIYFDDIKDLPPIEARDIATERAINAMNELRIELDAIVENKSELKKKLKEEKAYKKSLKKNHNLSNVQNENEGINESAKDKTE